MKKRFFALALACMMAFCFTACGTTDNTQETTNNTENAEGTENTDTAQLEDFTIVLDWYPNAIHSFLYTAIEKGYFAEEGLNLVINFPANTNDGISLPAAGKADVGMYYLQDAISHPLLYNNYLSIYMKMSLPHHLYQRRTPRLPRRLHWVLQLPQTSEARDQGPKLSPSHQQVLPWSVSFRFQ